jgi:cyclic pyranopterin phosphate synthase
MEHSTGLEVAAPWRSPDAMTMALHPGQQPAYKPNGHLRDALGRPLGSLRISVTDRCNLRCRYCMPQEEYVWLPREDLLTFEEAAQLASVFTALGVEKVRLTGGEPLLRRDLHRLVGLLAANPAIRDLAITTNGVLLAAHAAELRAAGLHRVSVSLDTLQPARFRALARRDELPAVRDGFRALAAAGFTGTKIDSVVIRGFNEDEIPALVEFGRAHSAEVRFLEYMDVGGATEWSAAQVFSRADILAAIARRYGRVEPLPADDIAAPAERFRLSDGATFGVVASTTTPFCRACDRSRLTADGMWFLCLYATAGVNLRELLRRGASPAELRERIAQIWKQRADRGAEQRKAARDRGAFLSVEVLRRNPHLEMHTRGG